MNKAIKRIIVISVFYFFIVISIVDAGLGVSPTIKEIYLKPGDTYKGSYIVVNTGTQDFNVNIEPIDWRKKYLEQKDTMDVSKWLFFEEKNFTIKAGKNKSINYEVKVPKNIKEEQVAQIFFAFNSYRQNKAFRTRLGVIFYLGVKGKSKLKTKIKKVKVNANKNKDGSIDLYAMVTLKNKGNIHIRPYGNVKILKYGDVIETIEIKKGKGIYANSTDSVSGFLKAVHLPGGKYKAIAEIDCDMYGMKQKLTRKASFTV